MITATHQGYQQSHFSTVQLEGTLFPIDVLQRIEQLDVSLDGLTASNYHHNGNKLNEVIADAWLKLLSAWKHTQKHSNQLITASNLKTTLEGWLLPLFRELGYGHLMSLKQPLEVDGKHYAVSHLWHYTPIHLVSFQQPLDKVVRTPGSTLRSSAYGQVQNLLNRSNDHLWGMVSNGLTLRLLRKNVSLTRQAYIEFDLETMMRGEAYADFTLLWLLCHQSRVETDRPTDCWLEQWAKAAHEQGIRALDQLREGVEQAINALGKGFLIGRGPANKALREKLHTGTLSGQRYYRQVLRLVYRLIILFVVEDRDVLFYPQASTEAKQRYLAYYSTRRLRTLSDLRMGTRHTDLFQGLWIVMHKLGQDEGSPELGMPALNGFLFSPDAIPDLIGCHLTNYSLLDAIRSLAYTRDKRTGARRPVNYKHLGSEELGSVYESLLELHPDLNIGDMGPTTFQLRQVSGNERKTSGSYYTPASLINCLLDSALDPVLDEASQQPDPEHAILQLKVCDPACGSGHFLIAAAHRIAKKLAAVRTGDEEPGPDERRRALRDVVGRCLYGVDINPMAVELCKVNLWMEAIEPGKPLSFLDTHILCGNSLLGTTPTLLAQGLPDSTFETLEGDDKKICSEYKKKNKQYTAGQKTLFGDDMQPWNHLGNLKASILQLDTISDDTVENIHRKQAIYDSLQRSDTYLHGRLLADAWCAAFVWKKTQEFVPLITQDTLRSIDKNPYSIPAWMHDKIGRLAEQYQFFHWHLAFPDVFSEPMSGEQPENGQMGWSGGFDVVLGNPPYISGENRLIKTKFLFQKKFQLAERQFDNYWLFMELGLSLTSREGKLALVVPDALLARDEAQNVRKAILNQGLKRLILCGNAFIDANVSTIIFVVDKQNKTHKISGEIFKDGIVRFRQECDKNRFLADPKHKFLIHISNEEAQVFSQIERKCKSLQHFAKITRGEEMGKKNILANGPMPILVGEDISCYFVKPPSRFVNTAKKTMSIYASPKIVIMKTSSKCIAALDRKGHVTMQSVYNLHITSDLIEYECLLAILNSRFVSCYIYKNFTSYKEIFPQLNQSTLLSIPIPSFSEKNDIKHQLKSFVTELETLKQKQTQTHISHEKHLLNQQIESITKQIDSVVYHSLYNLTELEVKFIEQNMI